MAFSLYVSREDVTTQLNDGAPFRLESAEGLSSAEVVRFEQGGPTQQGVTDLGYRVQPRAFTLNVLFSATTDAELDGYRDELMDAFRPLNSGLIDPWATETFGDNIPDLSLSVLRDDGEIRTLTIEAVGEIAIDLVPEERAAKLHRATIPLRAASPFWRGATTTLNVAIANWGLAGGQISGAKLIEYRNISGNTNWLDTGVFYSGDWAVAVITPDPDLGNGTAGYAWSAWYNTALGTAGPRLGWVPGAGYVYSIYNVAEASWPGGTAANYHVVESRSGTTFWHYWDGSALVTHASNGTDEGLRHFGKWRNHYYDAFFVNPVPVTRGAIYQNHTLADLTTLAPYILGSTDYVILPTVAGDMPVYPDIALTGPVTNPVLVNSSTGGSINLTGLALAAGSVAYLKMSTGNKTLVNSAGSSLMGSVTTAPVSMTDFYLRPPDSDFDGQNVIELSGSGITSATGVSVTWTEKYMSF